MGACRRSAFGDAVGIGVGSRYVVCNPHHQAAAGGGGSFIENDQGDGVYAFGDTRLAQVALEGVAVAQRAARSDATNTAA